jgi:hypothetical protein
MTSVRTQQLSYDHSHKDLTDEPITDTDEPITDTGQGLGSRDSCGILRAR